MGYYDQEKGQGEQYYDEYGQGFVVYPYGETDAINNKLVKKNLYAYWEPI